MTEETLALIDQIEDRESEYREPDIPDCIREFDACLERLNNLLESTRDRQD